MILAVGGESWNKPGNGGLVWLSNLEISSVISEVVDVERGAVPVSGYLDASELYVLSEGT